MQLTTVHIITNLLPDGAQQAMVRVLSSLGDRVRDCQVIALSGEGSLATTLRQRGIDVDVLRFGAVPASLGKFCKLLRCIRSRRPQVVVTWLYHADLLGGLAAKLAGRIPVVWNVRRSGLPPTDAKLHTKMAIGACFQLARFVPDGVVFCSAKSRSEHVARGYPPTRSFVVPNGFDLQTFRPRPELNARFRSEFGLAPGTALVGHFGRYHPDKDHRTLLAAAARMGNSDVRFVLCGRQIQRDNAELVAAIRRHGLADRCLLLGHRSDAGDLMAAMDVVVSSSRSEGFPNAVGEALASGVPCVGTDVGETRKIIGPGGTVVPPRDPVALARSCLALLRRSPVDRRTMGEQGRRHIAQHFGISGQADRHFRIWQAAAEGTLNRLKDDVTHQPTDSQGDYTGHAA